MSRQKVVYSRESIFFRRQLGKIATYFRLFRDIQYAYFLSSDTAMSFISGHGIILIVVVEGWTPERSTPFRYSTSLLACSDIQYCSDINTIELGNIPVLPLEKLQDRPVNNTPGWNFRQNPANVAVLGHPGKRWLIDRVLTRDWLREEFLDI
jgi:hypothetical protein